MDEHLKEKLKEKEICLIERHVLEARGDIGSGAFGSVCKAYHKGWKKEVAVKIMNIADRLTEKDERKLLNEAEMMMKLRHEHVLYIYGACIDSTGTTPVYGIVMHYLENGSVKSFYQTLDEADAPVPWSIRYRLLYEVIEGVIYLHSNRVLHLDLKAANVLLSEDLHAQICDFGLSKWNKMSVTGSHIPTSVGGTLTHFPPECLEDVHRKPSAQFDVYSYSIYMWEVLTGQQVYQNVHNIPQLMLAVVSGQRPDLSLIASDPPESCEACVVPLMKRCWDSDPDKRASVPEIMDVLQPLYDACKTEAQQAVPALVRRLRACRSESSDTSVSLEEYVSSKCGRHLVRDEVDSCNARQNSHREHISSRANATKQGDVKVTVYDKLINQSIQSMAWSAGENRNTAKTSESYVVTMGDKSNSCSTKAVENRIKTEKGGMTTVNQINVTGGSKVHIGDIHVRQCHAEPTDEGAEIGVNEQPQPEHNGKKVSNPKSMVDDSHLHKIAQQVGKCWKLMGRRCLLFEEGDLDALELDYSRLGTVEVTTQMLRKWKDRHGPKATRYWLATALIFVRKDHLVDILNEPAMHKQLGATVA